LPTRSTAPPPNPRSPTCGRSGWASRCRVEPARPRVGRPARRRGRAARHRGQHRREPDLPALAIVGRPNVGKSSLLNRLAGADLAIVDPTPGTTRDTVDSIVERDGRGYRLVDTAGMRRSFQQAEGADYFAFVRSLEAVDRADVALLVLEAPQGVAEQDQKVAVRAVEAGCGLVLLANKWDLMDDEARRQFGSTWSASCTSSTGRRCCGSRPAPAGGSRRSGDWSTRCWPSGPAHPHRGPQPVARQATERTPPPPARGRSVKVRYATQARVDPPELVLFTSGSLTPSYRRYLERACGAPSGSRARRCGWWCGSGPGSEPPEADGQAVRTGGRRPLPARGAVIS
jgi:small GTP-binding protein